MDNHMVEDHRYIDYFDILFSKKPEILQPLDITEKCPESYYNPNAKSKFEPVAVFGGKAIYQEQVANFSEERVPGTRHWKKFDIYYTLLYFNTTTDTWMQDYIERKIAPGFLWSGETLQSIVSNTTGEFQCTINYSL